MRQIRMLGFCLIAVFAMAAATAVPALAKKSVSPWAKFQPCPVNFTEEVEYHGEKERAYTTACTVAVSGAGSEFKAGNIHVQLEKPIILQGGLLGDEEDFETETFTFVAPEGAPMLTPVKQSAPSLEEVVNPAKLSAKELKRYEKAIAAGHTKGYVTIELAGEPSSVRLNIENLLDEEGNSLTLPVKVRLDNGFLGPDCYVGSNEYPIEIELTTGMSGALHGRLGSLYTEEEGAILAVAENSLVNNTYDSPGANGCGIADGADAALDSKIGLPSAAPNNTTKIDGTLYLSGAEQVRAHEE